MVPCTPFSHYLCFDQETGIAEYLAGIPTLTQGKSSGDIISRSYPEMQTLMVEHWGPYEELHFSYSKRMEYMENNQLEVKWESFELYHTDPESEPNVTKWKTIIAFPMK